jgi:2-polyprenyl-3-methyl-5-hydroxy-6-metoxy-1,4-benzoquinol methylase
MEIYESQRFIEECTWDELNGWSYEKWKNSKCRSYVTTSLVTSLVEKFIEKGKRLIDIGSSFGYFVCESRKRGFETEGIEPSQMLANIAKEKLGIQLHNCTVDRFEPSDTFSGIIVWDVLEHLYNPKEMLQHCGRLAKPGAYLFIQVPNYAGISDTFKTLLHRLRLKNNNFKHFGFPWHIYSFNKKSLGLLLEENGFTPLQFESWSHQMKEGKNNVFLAPLQRMIRKFCLSDYIVCVARYKK